MPGIPSTHILLDAVGPHRSLQGVLQEDGDGHGPHAAGHGCDVPRNLGARLEVHVAHQEVGLAALFTTLLCTVKALINR